MDSLVALFWITNPGCSWKTFVSNRVKKIAEVTTGLNVKWNHCPTDMNLADLGSRGANLDKLENKEWFTGPEWILDKDQWPSQPVLEKRREVLDEFKPDEPTFFLKDKETDEW